MKKLDKLTDGVNKFHLNDSKEKEEQKTKEDSKKRPTLANNSLNIKEYSDISKNNNAYTIEKIIGTGTFGVVYQVFLF